VILPLGAGRAPLADLVGPVFNKALQQLGASRLQAGVFQSRTATGARWHQSATAEAAGKSAPYGYNAAAG